MFVEQAGASQGVRVKICGITNSGDARAALNCAADALGFNFFTGSKRCIDARSEGEWLRKLPAEVCKVAVLVNPSWEEATAVAALPFIDALQLHGDETPAFCRRLAAQGIRFAKALPVREQEFTTEVPDFSTDTVLLDSASPRGFGGTGEAFPWLLGQRFVLDHPGLKVILAGGLTPDNVAEAVATVKPFGVDVTTGVESSPGRKDPARLRAFFAALGRG
jgi:phosphoribosylanthranilate isomerase